MEEQKKKNVGLFRGILAIVVIILPVAVWLGSEWSYQKREFVQLQKDVDEQFVAYLSKVDLSFIKLMDSSDTTVFSKYRESCAYLTAAYELLPSTSWDNEKKQYLSVEEVLSRGRSFGSQLQFSLFCLTSHLEHKIENKEHITDEKLDELQACLDAVIETLDDEEACLEAISALNECVE